MKKVLSVFSFILLFVLILQSGRVDLKDCVFADGEFSISSSSAYVCDFNTGKVIYEKNADEKKPIASMTKVVGLGIVFEEIDKGNLSLTNNVIVSQAASEVGGSSAFLDAGSSYSIEDLIKSVIIASANDSMVALAEHISGNEKTFVNRMNDYALSLGMNNTRFENATGLPSLNAYSTARDITMAFKKISDNSIFLKYSKIWMDELIHPSGRRTELVNTNRLVKTYDNIIGGKTGFTNIAKYCFVGAAKSGEMKVLASILGCDDSKVRFNEVKEMFNYAFSNFSNKLVVSKEIPVDKISIKNAKSNQIDVYSAQNLYNFQKNTENIKVDVLVKIDNIKAPIKSNSIVGKVYLVDENGIVITQSDLIIKCNVDKITMKDCFDKVITNW